MSNEESLIIATETQILTNPHHPRTPSPPSPPALYVCRDFSTQPCLFFAKQTQFPQQQERRNLFCRKGLPKQTTPAHSKKTNPIEPKQTQFQNGQYKHKYTNSKGLCQRTTNVIQNKPNQTQSRHNTQYEIRDTRYEINPHRCRGSRCHISISLPLSPLVKNRADRSPEMVFLPKFASYRTFSWQITSIWCILRLFKEQW
jgi:hypothetical protein